MNQQIIFIILMAGGGYLFGSLNFAIIITKIVTGKDIRKLGNLNAGMMNVFRNVGKGWGIMVGVCDAFKCLVPISLSYFLVFKGTDALAFSGIILPGIMAIIGHCKPLFNNFKGGKGAMTVMAMMIFLTFIPFVLAMLTAILIAYFFLKGVKFRYGRWVPIFFIIGNPVYVTILYFLRPELIHLPYIRVFDSFGYWPFAAWAVSLTTFALNIFFMKNRVAEVSDVKIKGSVRAEGYEENKDLKY